MDVDSGLVVPWVGASAASSGLAFIAAGTFRDIDYLQDLGTTVNALGFAERDAGKLHYAASNQVGDAVMLYGLSVGPIWQKVREARP